jgi:phage protein D
MADLMSSNKTDFEDFFSKYENFTVPSYGIVIDGTNLTDDILIINSIKVELSIKDVAGMAEIIISDCYDSENNGFKSEIKSKLKLGYNIKVSLGYGGKNEEIFSGYIEAINYEFGESPNITLVCMDAIHILMQNYSIEQKGNEKGLSTMIKELLDKQAGYISKSEIDNISSTGMQIAQNMSDYDFIKKSANENGFEFFIVAGKAYFRTAKKNKEPITTVSFGKNVIYFSREIKYRNVKIAVMGKDDINKITIIGTANGKTNVSNIQNAFVSNKTIYSVNTNTENRASKRAEVEVNNYLENAYSAKLICIGLPELIPGRYILLDNFDSDLDKKYYIRKVKHEYSPGEYTVTLDLSTTQ